MNSFYLIVALYFIVSLIIDRRVFNNRGMTFPLVVLAGPALIATEYIFLPAALSQGGDRVLGFDVVTFLLANFVVIPLFLIFCILWVALFIFPRVLTRKKHK